MLWIPATNRSSQCPRHGMLSELQRKRFPCFALRVLAKVFLSGDLICSFAALKIGNQGQIEGVDGVWGLHPSCVLCDLVDETYEHLFFECPNSSWIWGSILARFQVRRSPDQWST